MSVSKVTFALHPEDTQVACDLGLVFSAVEGGPCQEAPDGPQKGLGSIDHGLGLQDVVRRTDALCR